MTRIAPAGFDFHLPPVAGAQGGAVFALWNLEPSVLLGCALLVAVYLWAVRGRVTGGALLYFAGVLALLLALVSPLDALADDYLFSAHMLQHLLLVLVVPPLLLLGIPETLARKVLAKKSSRWVEGILAQPLAAWLLGVGTLWAWHIPALYNAALADERIHILEHLCFLVTAAIFWWPVVGRSAAGRIPALGSVAYLFAAALANTLLGIYFSFVPPGLYPAYVHPSDAFGVLATIRNDWGLTPAVDQQLGGLIMWVPGGLVYLGAIFAVFARWYSAPDTDEEGFAGEELRGVMPVAVKEN